MRRQDMSESYAYAFVVALSEVVSLFLIYRLWRSNAGLASKIALSVVGLFPLVGPFLIFWLQHDPRPSHPAFWDNVPTRDDVLQRWRPVFEARHPMARFRRWQKLMRPEKRR